MKYGIIGEKLPHSFSKEIHEMIGKYEYEKKEIAREDFDDFATKRDFLGINITIPYKRDIIPYLSYMSDGAKSIGAVNVAINKNGALYGYNTDFTGLMGLIKRAGFDFSGKTVLIFGAGGTSRTARAVSESLGASVIKFVKGSSCDMAISYEDVAREYKNADFIINTSPAGMYPHMEECPWDAAGLSFADFPNLSGVVDVVYNPLRTDFVNKALLSGIPAVGGLYMLVSQAVAAAELFVDESIDDSLTENIYKKLLADKENIVLTGMPGSGKSTIG
ncbi:MAG: shikimate dehydrogenase, partial [Eubacteriales bacterium]